MTDSQADTGYQPTVTPPDGSGPVGEREGSYFAAAMGWPDGKCPPDLGAGVRRLSSARSTVDFSKHTPKPPNLSVAQRLKFDRAPVEVPL